MPVIGNLVDCPSCKKEGLRIILTEDNGIFVCPLCHFRNQQVDS